MGHHLGIPIRRNALARFAVPCKLPDSMNPPRPDAIGSRICAEPLVATLLPADPRPLTSNEVSSLWRIFVAIGHTWKNTYRDSAGLKSSWLEFLSEKTVIRPSYVAEYLNAIAVVAELVSLYGEADAFDRLFLRNGLPADKNGRLLALDSRLAHAKHFVVDEFIRVQIVAGGFRNFVQPDWPTIEHDYTVNYNGFIAGSRFGRLRPARHYQEPRP
jgi:hypothetical protein